MGCKRQDIFVFKRVGASKEACDGKTYAPKSIKKMKYIPMPGFPIAILVCYGMFKRLGILQTHVLWAT